MSTRRGKTNGCWCISDDVTNSMRIMAAKWKRYIYRKKRERESEKVTFNCDLQRDRIKAIRNEAKFNRKYYKRNCYPAGNFNSRFWFTHDNIVSRINRGSESNVAAVKIFVRTAMHAIRLTINYSICWIIYEKIFSVSRVEAEGEWLVGS